MRVPGEAAAHLSWLIPDGASLLALARSPAHVAWAEIRHDPAAVLLVLRRAPADPRLRLQDVVSSPAVLDGALEVFDVALAEAVSPAAAPVPDWHSPDLAPVYRGCVALARLSGLIAEACGGQSSDRAWVAGLLAPLGWLAVSAVDPAAVAAVLADATPDHDPEQAQRDRWGLDQSALARRLARRWRLPSWVAAVSGSLGLPADVVGRLGADLPLVHIVRVAVFLAGQTGSGLRLVTGGSLLESADALGLSGDRVRALQREAPLVVAQPPEPRSWTSPHHHPLLRDLLALAADSRRGRDAASIEQLELEHDLLHRSVAEHRRTENDRLQELKLSALAELAGGAGHEINNPLAVISGQAQYLLTTETEPGRQRALHVIISQTQRIHGILNELMQFARPPVLKKESVAAAEITRDAVLVLGDLAEQRRVRLVCPDSDPSLRLLADPRHLRTALVCLLRNAIEAAPVEGWAGIRVRPAAGCVEFLVEDNGPGLSAGQREHLFDPFYSSRQAGRGRGLGLPTAWRLAREHGGDVLLDDCSGGLTRFLLRIPTEGAEIAPALPSTPVEPPTPSAPVLANGRDHHGNGSLPAA